MQLQSAALRQTDGCVKLDGNFLPMSTLPTADSTDTPSTVRVLLGKLRAGDSSASQELYQIVYRELRAIAARELWRERKAASLSPTELVAEAYLRLFAEGPPNAADREHFLAISCKVMRQLLVDRARRRQALRRAAPRPQLLADMLELDSNDPRIVLMIDDALNRLAEFAPRAARIVELRYFSGLEAREVADMLGTSVRTVHREWSMARAWLYGDLKTMVRL
jgi:RNA polymerase sigma-70 factor, ECF subfamily